MLPDAKRDGRKPIAMLTAYDAGFARVLDDAGVDCVLVGDSLGMVIQGYDTTVPVTVDDIVYHTALRRRGLSRAADRRPAVPGRCHAGHARARRVRACLQAGAAMVKLEEGGAPVVDPLRWSSAGFRSARTWV